MSRGYYVIALVGESPGVVTELLWHLAVREKEQVVGLELWTTQTGWAEGGERGLAAMGRAMFAELRRLAPALPPWPADLRPETDPRGGTARGVQVFVPAVAGKSLADVRSEDDAAAFSAALHARVQLLREDPERRLLGSLAGGRKTMTAAMHSAFTLFARRGDRLAHVLLHRALEAELKETRTLHAYAFPRGERAGVAEEDQIAVVDAPFFPAGEYLAAGKERSARLLVEAATAHLLGLRGTSSGRIEVQKAGRFAVLGVGTGVKVYAKAGLAYAILLRDGPLHYTELAERANAQIAGWLGRAPSGGTALSAEDDKTMRNLERRLEEAVGADAILATLIPRRGPSKGHRWRVTPREELDLDMLSVDRFREWFPREDKNSRPRVPSGQGRKQATT